MRIPFVILTGFLGSGKTTLTNRLLARRAERGARGKIGVIVNELGAVGIDGALLGGDAARQIELPGGCVCCLLGDDLDRTLLELVDANPELEAILLETTGVAEPIPIAWAVQRPPVSERVRMAAVVTLVDAANFRASRPLSPAVDAQLAYADVVLVTKASLAGDAESARVESDVRTIAPRSLIWSRSTDEHAAWLESVLADPDLAPVVSGEAARSYEDRPVAVIGAHRDHDGHDHLHSDEAGCRHPEHSGETAAHGIDSVWVPALGVVDLEELEDQLGALPANYVRIKGIVHATDGRDGAGALAKWIAIHRVGLRVSSEPMAGPPSQQACIVALGVGVAADALAACVDASAA